MKQYTIPFFVPFNVRNKIINDSKKDINEYKTKEQLQVLLSYMKEKQIYQGLEKSNYQKLSNPRNRSPFYKMGINHGFSQIGKLEVLEMHYQAMGIKNVGLVGRLSSSFPDTNLKAYWKFNEASGNIINQSQSSDDLGAGADLQVSGAAYNQAVGPFNYSMLFDGVNDSAVAGTSASQFNFLHNTTALWSFIFWIRVVSVAQDEGIFGTSTSINIGTHLRFGNASGTELEFNIANGGAIITGGTTITFPDTTSWHYYAITYDQSLSNTNAKIKYDDANLTTLNKSANTPSNSNATNAGTFAKNPAAAASYGNYYIAECSLWNKVLSSADQTTLYNSGSGRAIY